MGSEHRFPVAIPFGGGGNRELITVVKDKAKSYLNTIGKSRFSKQDGTDITILLDIADGDPGTINFIEALSAASFAEDGLSRGEQIMMYTGVIAPSSMPGGNHHQDGSKDDRQKVSQKKGRPDEDEM